MKAIRSELVNSISLNRFKIIVVVISRTDIKSIWQFLRAIDSSRLSYSDNGYRQSKLFFCKRIPYLTKPFTEGLYVSRPAASVLPNVSLGVVIRKVGF
jgi:hypothetical protein